LTGPDISLTVNDDETGVTNADVTVYAPRFRFFSGRLQGPMPGGHQSGCNGFTLIGLNRLPVEEELNGIASDDTTIQPMGFQQI
jgi:hypothetical protein